MKIEEEIKQYKFRSPYQKVAINLLYTSSWLETSHREFLSTFNITTHQFNILRILRGQYPSKISGAEIKGRMIDRNSDISRLLDRMVVKNLIDKSQCSEDKRAFDIVITNKGLEVLKDIDYKMDQIEDSLIHLTREEAEQLNFLLDKTRG